ncbi:MAG: type II secretion system major pseudopilin GspG [Planctomycetaceae bacterium]|jgi:general secretion pathway protein G|nr:type II secretion system major pseudopilin GspG [Planctomycetaceae bacterium]
MKNNKQIRSFSGNYKYRAAFTLIEIMVVLFIITMIAGSAVLATTSYLERGRKKTTRQYISQLDTAIKSFNMAVGKYPSALQDLLTCPSEVSPAKWGDSYVTHLQQADPWGYEYRYNTPGQHVKEFDVWSIGPDGQDGTEDDIGNWSTD